LHHQNFSDGCHLFPYDLIYEGLLNLCHHEADENRSTHDEAHDHHEQVFQESTLYEVLCHHVLDALVSIHVLVNDHHELVFPESTLCEELCHHAVVSQESTHDEVHDHREQDALESIHVLVHDHHELVSQESTLYEGILNLNLHEKRFRLCEHYGLRKILLNLMESIQDDHQHFVLDGHCAVHG